MKVLSSLLAIAFFTCTTLSAQFETTLYLYDTISEGPYLEQEKKGYNFLFKNQKSGTMTTSLGQVIKPTLSYDIFNHYHIQADGTVDSLFSIPVRVETKQNYQLYAKGLPRLIQYRVGTSNDPSIEKIESKYPLITSERNNDESLVIAKTAIEGTKYEYVSKAYNQANYKETISKSIVEVDAEEGSWIIKHQYSAPNIDEPISLLVYGKKIEGDKDRKFNDSREFKFLAVDREGNVVRDEEIIFDRSYDFQNSGLIHSLDGSFAGFYMSMVELSGRANKDYNSSIQKVLFFDSKGYYDSETTITLPYEVKAKEVAMQRILKVVDNGKEKRLILHTPGVKKNNVQEGIYSFSIGEESSEVLSFQTLSEIYQEQDQRNNFEGGPAASQDFKYGLKLENSDFLAIASENGIDLQFLHLDNSGNIKKRSTGYLLNDIASQKNLLSFEYLNNNKVLVISKVGYEKGVYTSYGIYDAKTGNFQTIQPEIEIATIHSYRNGDDIIVYGSSFEDDKMIHMILYKLDSKGEGISSIDQD